MPEPVRIGLDNPAFFGRLRPPVDRRPPAATIRLRTRPAPGRADGQVAAPPQDNGPAKAPEAPKPVWMQPLSSAASRPPAVEQPPAAAAPIALVKPQPFAVPAVPRLQHSSVLTRQAVPLPEPGRPARPPRLRRYSKPQLALMAMAGLVFIVGVAASWQTFRTNHTAAAQISTLSKKVDKQAAGGNQNSAVPSTTKPTVTAFNKYVVAPDLPRYLVIPRLGVEARVLQVGVTNTGALGTPPDIYDTAWYTGSAKPGQPGATLIDGHVSSWTAHGVFYGLKTLAAGDNIQIIRGDGATLNYQVVKTQTYGAGNVDMQAAVTPVTAGKSGLNLITCTGQVIKGTSEFNERVIVFAQQV